MVLLYFLVNCYERMMYSKQNSLNIALAKKCKEEGARA